MAFQKATKAKARLRMAIDGPSGSGKTYTSLLMAQEIAKVRGGRVAVVDTERGSASKYADRFDFDTLELSDFDPRNYVAAIHEAEQSGAYAVIVLDSISHGWEGKGGLLEQHDNATARQKTANSYTAWRDITPVQQDFVDAMLQSPLDVIATMRSKMEYVQEKDEKTGKTEIRKVGMAPVQRAGVEYEFDIVGDMDVEHKLIVSKSRCAEVADAVVRKPDAKFAATIIAWLTDGEDTPAAPPAPVRISTSVSAPVPSAPVPQPTRSLTPAPIPAPRLASAPQPQDTAPATRTTERRQYEHTPTPPAPGPKAITKPQEGLLIGRAKTVFGEQYGVLLPDYMESIGLPANMSELALNQASWLIDELGRSASELVPVPQSAQPKDDGTWGAAPPPDDLDDDPTPF